MQLQLGGSCELFDGGEKLKKYDKWHMLTAKHDGGDDDVVQENSRQT